MEPKRVLLWGQPKNPFGTLFFLRVEFTSVVLQHIKTSHILSVYHFVLTLLSLQSRLCWDGSHNPLSHWPVRWAVGRCTLNTPGGTLLTLSKHSGDLCIMHAPRMELLVWVGKNTPDQGRDWMTGLCVKNKTSAFMPQEPHFVAVGFLYSKITQCCYWQRWILDVES